MAHLVSDEFDHPVPIDGDAVVRELDALIAERDALRAALHDIVTVYRNTGCPPADVRESTIADIYRTHGVANDGEAR